MPSKKRLYLTTFYVEPSHSKHVSYSSLRALFLHPVSYLMCQPLIFYALRQAFEPQNTFTVQGYTTHGEFRLVSVMSYCRGLVVEYDVTVVGSIIIWRYELLLLSLYSDKMYRSVEYRHSTRIVLKIMR